MEVISKNGGLLSNQEVLQLLLERKDERQKEKSNFNENDKRLVVNAQKEVISLIILLFLLSVWIGYSFSSKNIHEIK